jgi:hypothetical protein
VHHRVTTGAAFAAAAAAAASAASPELLYRLAERLTAAAQPLYMQLLLPVSQHKAGAHHQQQHVQRVSSTILRTSVSLSDGAGPELLCIKQPFRCCWVAASSNKHLVHKHPQPLQNGVLALCMLALAADRTCLAVLLLLLLLLPSPLLPGIAFLVRLRSDLLQLLREQPGLPQGAALRALSQDLRWAAAAAAAAEAALPLLLPMAAGSLEQTNHAQRLGLCRVLRAPTSSIALASDLHVVQLPRCLACVMTTGSWPDV